MGKHSGLTWFGARQVWAKKIGGRRFYFGPDQATSMAEASAIIARWNALDAAHQMANAGESLPAWPDGEPNRGAIRVALGIVPALTPNASPAIPVPAIPVPTQTVPVAPQSTQSVPAIQRVAVGGLTVEQAAKMYLAERKAGQITERTYNTFKGRVGAGIDVLGRAKTIDSVDQAALVGFVANWQKPGNASLIYAKHVVQAIKAFLVWCSEHDQIKWTRPGRFDSIMAIDASKPRNDEEREALKAKILGDDSRFFTVDQLRTLYKAACPIMRAWLMLGLNCAYYPADLAVLRHTDFKRDGKANPKYDRIETLRGKTLVASKHDLWPETVAAINAAKAKAGKWLFSFDPKGIDPVARITITRKYDTLRQKVCPDAPDFKYLRHTSANEIKKLSSGEISEVHLAHTEALKMQGPYTARLWDDHAKAIKKLRGVFAKVAALAALMVAASIASAQPVEWRVQDGGNGHWYEVTDPVFNSWTQARDYAVSVGGHLATLTSMSECTFVAALRSGDVFLGGYQDAADPDYSEPSGGWRWVTGEPWQFQNWQPGEPNNGASGQPEGYLSFWRFNGQISNAAWNDWPDSFGQQISAAIEWDADCNGDGIVDKGQILSGELADANGNGVPDVCEGSCGGPPGPGYALSLDGSSGYVTIADNAALDFTQTVTIEAWIRVRQFHAGRSQRFFSKGDGQNWNTNRAFEFQVMDTSGGWQGGFLNGTANYPEIHTMDASESLVLGEWCHVAETLDTATSTIRLFRNGSLVEERTVGASGVPFTNTVVTNSSYPLELGNNSAVYWSPTPYFDGDMAEVRLWNIARTPAQIAADYGHTIDPATPGLVAYYRLNEGSGLVAHDLTANGLHGALIGGATWIAVGSPMSSTSFTTQPAPCTVCPTGSGAFTVAASGSGNSYQWQIEAAPGNWVPLTATPQPLVFCGPSQTGMAFATSPTAATTSIGVTGCRGVQRWNIRAVVTNACGSVTSNPATLTVCPADFNCSGAISVQDIFDFLRAWFAGDPNADMDSIPGLQVGDIFAFLNFWFTGCS